MANIIIPGRKFGKTRSEQAKNLRKEGWGSTMSREQEDKCRFLEKKYKKPFFSQAEIDKVK